MLLATKTLALIEAASRQPDFHREFKRAIADYQVKEDSVRGHLGASLIGRSCPRALWYGFRWANGTNEREKVAGRMIRLWQRGDIEEFRFIALLRIAGIQVWNVDENGKQIGFESGYFAGSMDGIAGGVPDVPEGEFCNLEFKTHNTKSFAKLLKEGVRSSKFEHFVQMQIYMKKKALRWALYLAVNKDTDEIHAEIVAFEQEVADKYDARAIYIIEAKEAPPKIHNDASWFECKFCDFHAVCHRGQEIARSCRTCAHGFAGNQKKMWGCNYHQEWRSKEEQLEGCSNYVPIKTLPV